MCLNHPQTTPPTSIRGKTVFHEISPWCQKGWELLPYSLIGNGTPLQYSCLENPMDGGAWWAADHGVAKSWT